MTLLTYEEVKDKIGDEKRTLLLGNGFSMAYNKERFSFTNLFDSAVNKKLINKSSPVYKIFQHFESKDFEEVIKLLGSSFLVFDEYNIKYDKPKIEKDISDLKEHLVDIITNNHPDKITDIKDNEFENSMNFISFYEKIYTLNYDLLLYWSCLKLLDNSTIVAQSKLKVNDGFIENDDKEYVRFSNEKRTDQTIFYLHGGLHIYDKKSEIIKETYSRTGENLKDQTLKNLGQNIYPVFISEGNSENKKAKIIHNAYLNHCYKSLATSGTKDSHLVIFGTYLKASDNHIKDIILKGKFENIYIGLSGVEQKSLFSDFENTGKNISYYDYTTATVWR